MRVVAAISPRILLVALLLLGMLALGYVSILADETPAFVSGTVPPPPPTGVPPTGTQYQPLILHQPTITAP
jgi:hypothetical protein